MNMKYITFVKLTCVFLICELQQFRFEFRGVFLITDIRRERVPLSTVQYSTVDGAKELL